MATCLKSCSAAIFILIFSTTGVPATWATVSTPPYQQQDDGATSALMVMNPVAGEEFSNSDLNEAVQEALYLFQGPEREFFIESYRRSGIYQKTIAQALRKEGLPEALSWLPLIESGFNPRAFSRTRALGLWQFIRATGYKYGLKQDQWVDERLDPEKSTRAAISRLKDLNETFHDWMIVLAAWNCGKFKVKWAINSDGVEFEGDFWSLYEKLPDTTSFNVPRFLAVLLILNDPEAQGFELPDVDTEIESVAVRIEKVVSLHTIAQYLDVNIELLRDLNPELVKDCTPDRPYNLRVPRSKVHILMENGSESSL